MANEHYTHTVILKPIICGCVSSPCWCDHFLSCIHFIRFVLHALLDIAAEKPRQCVRACVCVCATCYRISISSTYKLRIKNILARKVWTMQRNSHTLCMNTYLMHRLTTFQRSHLFYSAWAHLSFLRISLTCLALLLSVSLATAIYNERNVMMWQNTK